MKFNFKKITALVFVTVVMFACFSSAAGASQGAYEYVYAYPEYSYFPVLPHISDNSAFPRFATVNVYTSETSSTPFTTVQTDACGYFSVALSTGTWWFEVAPANRTLYVKDGNDCSDALPEAYYSSAERVSALIGLSIWNRTDVILNEE